MKNKLLRSIGLVALVCMFLLSGCQTFSGSNVTDAAQPNFDFTQEKVCSDDVVDLYYNFIKNAIDTGVVIPALQQDYVPQGLAYWKEKDWYVVSGYFKVDDPTPSALVCMDAKTGKYVGEYILYNAEGESLTGHFGGVAISEDNLYVANNDINAGGVHRVSLSALKTAKAKDALQVEEVISVPVSPSFLNFSNGVLWVGEYHRAETHPKEHLYVNNDGTQYYALALGYKEDKTRESGIESDPSYALSIPDKVQGFAVAEDGRIFLSRSYGRKNNSTFTICQNPLGKEPDQMIMLNEKEMPMWFLDKTNGLQDTISFPMSEGCFAIGQDIYVSYESAATYHRTHSNSRFPTDTIWKYTLP